MQLGEGLSYLLRYTARQYEEHGQYEHSSHEQSDGNNWNGEHFPYHHLGLNLANFVLWESHPFFKYTYLLKYVYYFRKYQQTTQNNVTE